MTTTIEQFRQALHTTGLICDAELESLLDEMPFDDRPQTPEALGAFLMNRHKLTHYQVRRILAEKVDDLLLGNYVIQDVIRNGAMGIVYRARHAQMKREVALKVILSNLAEDPECVARFHREVHLAARLDHPNIVTAYDASEENGQLFLVMEYIEGEDLKTIINKHGAIPIADALDYIIQAARGLQYAHSRGVIHRDVKPSNLLLGKKGTIKLLDIGLAMEYCNRNDSDLTIAGGLLGSVNYMAPEQARDARNADARSDIYSLGCTLWYLLAGSFIYEEKTVVNRILAHRERPVPDLESLGQEIPDELQTIFQKMVAKHPDDRYQSMTDLLEDLEQLQSQLPAPGVDSSEHACDTKHGASLHDTDHILSSTGQHLIDLQDDTPEEYPPEDPTRVSEEAIRTGRLQTVLIVVGGFAIGCLIMLGFQYLEPRGLNDFQDLKTSTIQWFGNETDSQRENRPETVVAEEIPAQSSDSESPATGVDDDSSDSSGTDAGRLILPRTPFSPEQARTYQQRWAAYLGTEVEQTNSLGIKLILLPPGTYQMGSDDDDLAELFRMFPDELLTYDKQFDQEHPQHTVTLTRPFYMSAEPITFVQFQRFVNEVGYQVQPATAEAWEQLRAENSSAIDNLPIQNICWNDAAAFCQWLSERDERLYRLPTEAEWEYAARAGSQDLFGHDLRLVYEQEWWAENTDGLQAAGLKKPNAFGLHDMCGNVREYCQDFFSKYPMQEQTDPLIDMPPSEDHRVVRGGGASCKLYEIRPGRRSCGPAGAEVVKSISFRIVSPVVIPDMQNLQSQTLRSNAE